MPKKLFYSKQQFDYDVWAAGRQDASGQGNLTYQPFAAKDGRRFRLALGEGASPLFIMNPAFYYALGGQQAGIHLSPRGWVQGSKLKLPRAYVGPYSGGLLDFLHGKGVDVYDALGDPADYVPSSSWNTVGHLDDKGGNEGDTYHPTVFTADPVPVEFSATGGDLYICAPSVVGDGGSSSGEETISTVYVVTSNNGPGTGPPPTTVVIPALPPIQNTGGYTQISEDSEDEVSETGINCSSYMNPFDPFDPLTYTICGYYRTTVSFSGGSFYRPVSVTAGIYAKIRAAYSGKCRRFRLAGGEIDFAGTDAHGDAVEDDVRAFFSS